MACSHPDLDLCFFGGTCNATTPTTPTTLTTATTAGCSCPPGFSGDTSLFLQNNCALPSRAYAAQLGATTLAAVPVTALLARAVYRRRDRRTTLRDLGVAALLLVVAAWATTAAMLGEGGMTRASGVLYGASTTLSGAWLRVCAALMTQSMTGIRVRGAQPGSRGVSAACAVFAAVGVATAIVFPATAGSPQARNQATCALFFASAVALAAISVAVRHYTKTLEAVLVRSEAAVNKTSKFTMADVVRRLNHFACTFTALMTNIMCVALVIPAVFLALGSWPFIYALMLANYVGLILAVGRSTLTLMSDAPHASATSRTSGHSRAAARWPSASSPSASA